MLSEQLHRLAGDVARLAPSHRDPERFHEAKSEIAGALRSMAEELVKAQRNPGRAKVDA